MTDSNGGRNGETVVYVVYTDGPSGSYPYGVFATREAAAEAREAIIKKLESGEEEVLDGTKRTWLHQLAGSYDEQTKIEEYQVRTEFAQDDLDDLFEDYD